MTRNEWMRGEINSWMNGGLIDRALAERLEARYLMSGKRFSLGTILIGSFGALLVGLGIIALFAANWDEFGRATRAAISVAPVILCALGAASAARCATRNAAVWEPIGILWAISILAAISLVAQTYQVGGSVPGLILLIALLTLPITWVTPSASVMALWTLYPVVWAFSKCNRWQDCSHPYILVCALALMALSIPAFIAYLKRCGARGPFPSVQFIMGLSYSVGLSLIVIRTIDFTGSDAWPSVYTFWAGAALVGILGRLLKLSVWSFVATLVAAIAATAFGFDNDPGNYILALILAVGIVIYGIRTVRLTYVNIGSLLAINLVLAKFFSSSVSFTVKGIVLVTCGIALTAANLVFIHLKKSEGISK